MDVLFGLLSLFFQKRRIEKRYKEASTRGKEKEREIQINWEIQTDNDFSTTTCVSVLTRALLGRNAVFNSEVCI